MKKYLGATAVTMLMAGSAFADPYVTYPGTAARGMGTAFTAVATDVSAVWYNPAGIAWQADSVTVEVSQSPGFDAAITFDPVADNFFGVVDDFSTDGATAFIAGTWSFKDDLASSGSAVGLYYYEPYQMQTSFYAVDPTDSDILFLVDLDEEIAIYGATYAYTSELSGTFRWSVGASLEWVEIDDNSTVAEFDRTTGNSVAQTASDSGENDGIAGTISALVTVYQPENFAYDPKSLKGWRYNVGLTYRLESDTSFAEYTSTTGSEREDIIFKKPQSTDLGFAASTSFSSFGMSSDLTLAYSYSLIDYTKASSIVEAKYDKSAFGASLTLRPDSSFVDQLDLRIGYYSTSVNDESLVGGVGTVDESFPEVDGFTLGLGVRKDKFVLDFSAERRGIEGVKNCEGGILPAGNEAGVPINICDTALQNQDYDDWFISASARFLFRK